MICGWISSSLYQLWNFIQFNSVWKETVPVEPPYKVYLYSSSDIFRFALHKYMGQFCQNIGYR